MVLTWNMSPSGLTESTFEFSLTVILFFVSDSLPEVEQLDFACLKQFYLTIKGRSMGDVITIFFLGNE